MFTMTMHEESNKSARNALLAGENLPELAKYLRE
jgi:hypothetical protein